MLGCGLVTHKQGVSISRPRKTSMLTCTLAIISILPYSHRLEVHHCPKLRIGADVDVTMNSGKSRVLKRGLYYQKMSHQSHRCTRSGHPAVGITCLACGAEAAEHHRYAKGAEMAKFGKSSPNGGEGIFPPSELSFVLRSYSLCTHFARL